MSNDLSELARVNIWLTARAQRLHAPAQTVERLDVCATEALTNIMTHAYADRAPHQIALRLDRRGEHLALEIQDDGMAFDPRLSGEPPKPESLDDATIGGWGIPLVRRFSDELHYRRAGGRNHLTIIFHVPGALPS